MSLSGSINAAFDDMRVEDPDFGFIQGKLDSNDLMLFYLICAEANLSLWLILSPGRGWCYSQQVVTEL